mmetsp:Transcript_20232/g.60423  ORF Transcript_20232/g.60423 Transcript_20232/m.60423 type:complete len:817 (+) Transcript_20232:208-2658(+)
MHSTFSLLGRSTTNPLPVPRARRGSQQLSVDSTRDALVPSAATVTAPHASGVKVDLPQPPRGPKPSLPPKPARLKAAIKTRPVQPSASPLQQQARTSEVATAQETPLAPPIRSAATPRLWVSSAAVTSDAAVAHDEPTVSTATVGPDDESPVLPPPDDSPPPTPPDDSPPPPPSSEAPECGHHRGTVAMEQKAVESGAVQDNDIGTEVSAQASTLLARTTLDYAYDSTDDEDVAEYRSYGHDENKLDVNADADGESISKDRTGQDIVAAHALVPSSESEANGNAAVADAQGKATEDDVDREHCMVVRTKRRSPPSAPRSHFLASRKISEDRRQVLSQHMAMDLKMKQQRMDFQKKLLHSYREDLSYWITEMCGEEISNQSEPFFEAIADGVILCRVAHAVCDAENSYITDNVGDANPTLWAPPKFNPRAKKGTFVARDNIHAFIMWSRQFGVPESALFETEDLVAAKELKNVLYTLMDVARLSHLSAERLPQLIQLEREIDSEIIAEHDEDDLANYPPPARVKPPLPPKPVGLKLLLAPQEPAEDEADRRPSLSSVTEEAEKEDGEVLADMIDLTESVLCEESSDVADEELISTAPSPEPEAAAEEEREEGADEEEEEEEDVAEEEDDEWTPSASSGDKRKGDRAERPAKKSKVDGDSGSGTMTEAAPPPTATAAAAAAAAPDVEDEKVELEKARRREEIQKAKEKKKRKKLEQKKEARRREKEMAQKSVVETAEDKIKRLINKLKMSLSKSQGEPRIDDALECIAELGTLTLTPALIQVIGQDIGAVKKCRKFENQRVATASKALWSKWKSMLSS